MDRRLACNTECVLALVCHADFDEVTKVDCPKWTVQQETARLVLPVLPKMMFRLTAFFYTTLLLVWKFFRDSLMLVFQFLVSLLQTFLLIRGEIPRNLSCTLLDGVKQDDTRAVLQLGQPSGLQSRPCG